MSFCGGRTNNLTNPLILFQDRGWLLLPHAASRLAAVQRESAPLSLRLFVPPPLTRHGRGGACPTRMPVPSPRPLLSVGSFRLLPLVVPVGRYRRKYRILQ